MIVFVFSICCFLLCAIKVQVLSGVSVSAIFFQTAIVLQTLVLALYWLWLFIQLQTISIWSLFIFGIIYLPFVSASSMESFPDIPFTDFADFVNQNFDSDISLATVLTVFNTLMHNSDLLNLHFYQQKATSQTVTAWMAALVRGLKLQLDVQAFDTLLLVLEKRIVPDDAKTINTVSAKLNNLANLLFDTKENIPVMNKTAIEPIYLLCPQTRECETEKCDRKPLSRMNQIPTQITLLQGTQLAKNALLLPGNCTKCNTIYYPDYASYLPEENSSERRRFYLPSAKYVKIGRTLWADRSFSNATVQAMYHFHASTSAIMEF